MFPFVNEGVAGLRTLSAGKCALVSYTVVKLASVKRDEAIISIWRQKMTRYNSVRPHPTRLGERNSTPIENDTFFIKYISLVS